MQGCEWISMAQGLDHIETQIFLLECPDYLPALSDVAPHLQV